MAFAHVQSEFSDHEFYVYYNLITGREHAAKLAIPNYLEIKTYPSTGNFQHFTTLHIVSNTAQVTGRAKADVEKNLSGHTARGGPDIVWHQVFLQWEWHT